MKAATAVQFVTTNSDAILGMATDSSGNVYISNTGAAMVVKVNSTGYAYGLVGTGVAGFSGDGSAATSAKLYWPCGLAFSSVDNSLFIADYQNHRIRKLSLTSMIITTYVGSQVSFTDNSCFGNNQYVRGDTDFNNVPVRQSLLYKPIDVAVDSIGNLYWVEYAAHILKKATRSTGMVSTLVGVNCNANVFSSTPASASYVGPPMQYPGLYYPYSIVVDIFGNVYFAEAYSEAVRMITADGNTLLGSVAGNGRIQEFSQYSAYTAGMPMDGRPATSIGLNQPRGLAVTTTGDLFIGTVGAPLIKRVRLTDQTPTSYPTPSPTSNYTGLGFPTNRPALYYSGNNFGLGDNYLSVECPGIVVAEGNATADARSMVWAASLTVADYSTPTAAPAASGCFSGYSMGPSGDVCFSSIIQSPLSYAAAIEECAVAGGGTVANLRSVEDESFLNDFFGSQQVSQYWIGLQNFVWSSGSKSTYANWRYRNIAYSCVVANSGYVNGPNASANFDNRIGYSQNIGWNSSRCNTTAYAFVCELPGLYSASPTLEPVIPSPTAQPVTGTSVEPNHTHTNARAHTHSRTHTRTHAHTHTHTISHAETQRQT